MSTRPKRIRKSGKCNANEIGKRFREIYMFTERGKKEIMLRSTFEKGGGGERYSEVKESRDRECVEMRWRKKQSAHNVSERSCE